MPGLDPVLGHEDWSARNIRLASTGVIAAYDWDSLQHGSEPKAVRELDIVRKNVNYQRLVDVFEALADPTRRRVVQLLGARPHRAGELAEATGMSQPAMSRHLKILLTSGLIEDERIPEDARVRLFKLQPDSLVAVQAFLDQLRAEWRTQLRSFKQHVERTPRWPA